MIEGPEPLAGDLKRVAEEILSKGIAEGAFPAERGAPTGEALWIGLRERPDAFATMLSDAKLGLWLDILWVEPDLRRQGLAAALLARATEIARSRGISSLSLGSLIANPRMTGFALKNGFAPIAIVWARKA